VKDFHFAPSRRIDLSGDTSNVGVAQPCFGSTSLDYDLAISALRQSSESQQLFIGIKLEQCANPKVVSSLQQALGGEIS
jgi:hypothetical protein